MPLSCTVHYFKKYLWSSHAVLELLEMDVKKKGCKGESLLKNLLSAGSNKKEKWCEPVLSDFWRNHRDVHQMLKEIRGGVQRKTEA